MSFLFLEESTHDKALFTMPTAISRNILNAYLPVQSPNSCEAAKRLFDIIGESIPVKSIYYDQKQI